MIELLVTLALLAVLFSLALPDFAAFIGRQRSVAAVNGLVGAVQIARNAAVTGRTTTTLCPAASGRCGARDTWHLGALVFEDDNGNGRREEAEAIVARLPRLRAGERVYWRSFRNRGYLQFSATGFTSWQNGHFLYCSRDRDPRLARQVIINAQGRARMARDRDGDGIAEDARGRPLQCP